MISNRIKNCDLSEEDKLNLNLILDSGDIEFVQNYLKEIEMKSTAAKNLPTMEICRLYEQGWSVKALADKYDCTTSSIAQHLGKGGFIYDRQSQKWVKAKQITMSVTVKKNRQEDIVTWLLKGGHTQSEITTKIVAEKFDCTPNQASGYLSSISKKGILGMEWVGRGMYRFNPVLPSGVNQNEQAAVASEPRYSIPCVKSDKNDGFEHIPAILALADKLGGLNKLIAKAQILVQIKNL